MQNGRYRAESDLIGRVLDIKRRIEILEGNPRIGATAIDTGNLLVRIPTNIVVEDDEGNAVITATGQSVFGPTIGFTPAGPITQHAELSGRDRLFDLINQTYIEYGVYDLADPGNTTNGGYTVLFQTGATVGYNPAAGGVADEVYFQCRNEQPFGLGLFQDTVRIVGKWVNDTSISDQDSIYSGTRAVGAAGSATISYPVTYATTVYPVVTVMDTGAVVSFCLTAQSAASFTVAWSNATAKTINMWNVRM